MRRIVVSGLALVVLGCPKGQVDDSTGEVTATTAAPGGSTSSGVPTTGAATGGATGSSSGSGTGSSGGGSSGSGGSSSGAVDTSSGTGGSGTSTGGSSSTGAGTSTGGSSSTGEALLFDCFGCSCDAKVSFCRQVFAGFAGPDLPACPVVSEEGLGSGCVLYPVDCDPPSCACLPTMNNNCFCTEQAPGVFEVTCPLP